MLPYADLVVNRIIKSYFTFEPLYNNKKSRHIDVRLKRLSLNKIIVSKSSVEHNNNNVTINLYIYNRNKKVILHKLKALYNKIFPYMEKLYHTAYSRTRARNTIHAVTNPTTQLKHIEPKQDKQQNKYVFFKESDVNPINFYRKVRSNNKSVVSLSSISQTTIGGCSQNNKNKSLLVKGSYVGNNNISRYKKINLYNNIVLANINLYDNAHIFNNMFEVIKNPTFFTKAKISEYFKVLSKNSPLIPAGALKLATGLKKSMSLLLKTTRIKTEYNLHKSYFINTLYPFKSSTHPSDVKQMLTKYENLFSAKSSAITPSVNKLTKTLFKKEIMFNFYIKMLHFNTNKLKKWFILRLKNIISNVYKKNVNFNIINLKYMYLNSDILSESIATKLRNRENRLLKVLKKSLFQTKLPYHYNKFIYISNKKQKFLGYTQENLYSFWNSVHPALNVNYSYKDSLNM